MKRSKALKLVTMATATVALAGCKETIDTEGRVFSNVYQCEQSDIVPDADCDPLFQEGTKIHEATAPRYSESYLCERDHGNATCQQATDGAKTYYSPSPIGYFLTGALVGSTVSNTVRPVYSERDGRRRYMTGGGTIQYLGNGLYGTGSKSVKKYTNNPARVAPKIQTRTSIAPRTGFGGRSSSFGG